MGNIKPVYGKEAREGLFQGITILNDAVKVTLGPRGRNVLMRKVFEGIHPSKDGVTVAKEIELSDELQNMGVILVKQTSENTNDQAGDGTTTSTLLAWAMTNMGLIFVNKNSNPVLIKKGIDMAVQEVINATESYTRPVNGDYEMITNIATISANNDKEIGNLIGEGLKKIGINGTIKVEESDSYHTYLDTLQGVQFKRGYASPYFITDSDKMEILYDTGCMVTITREKLTEYSQIKPIVDYAVQENVAIAIIADDYTNELLAELVSRKLRAQSKVFLIKSPYFGLKRDEYLEDLSIITGAAIVSTDSSISYQNFKDSYFGRVDKCLVTAEATMMLNGQGDPDILQKHIARLDAMEFNNPLETQRNKERVDMLTGGIGVLFVGAASEGEMKEKKDRVDDALSATRAAIEEGVIPGGGVVLLKIAHDLVCDPKLNSNIAVGYAIVKEAIRAPFAQILRNAGMEEEQIVDIAIRITKGDEVGYDAANDKFCDPLVEGILDPVKVTRVALLNAASVAGTVLTTECVLVNDNIQKEESNLPDFLRH